MQAGIYPGGAGRWVVFKSRFPAMILHWAAPKIPKSSLRESQMQVMELPGYTGLAGKKHGWARNYSRCFVSFAAAGDGCRVIFQSPKLMSLWHCIYGALCSFSWRVHLHLIRINSHNPLENENKGGAWLLPNHSTLLPNCEIFIIFLNAWKCTQK